MGLASALAAQGYAAPPQQQPQQQQSQQHYPQHQHQQPTQQGWLAGGPGGGGGAPPPASGSAAAAYPPMPYGVPPTPQPASGMAGVVASKLSKIVQVNQLGAFYPPDRLAAVADRVTRTVDFHALAARWRMPVELAVDLSALALYDVVIYADDSGSMESDNGERIDDLKLIVSKVAEVATLFDDDGIEVRFINSNVQGNNIKTPSDASRLLTSLEYRWDTKLATQMEAKILAPMAYSKRLAKPLLVVTVTDGEPSDKPADKIVSVIRDCVDRMTRAGFGPHAVAFQFAQVGKDREAQDFLSRLDRHPQVGKMIDCTSYFELEQAEYAAKGITLSVEAWLVKLMVGAVDPEYDEQDEGGAPPPAAAPSGGGFAWPGVGGSGYPQQQQQQQQQQQPAGPSPYSQPAPAGFYAGQQPFQQQPHQQQPVAYPAVGGYVTGYPPVPQHQPSHPQQQQGAPPPGYPGAHQPQQPQQQQRPPQKQGFFGKLLGL